MADVLTLLSAPSAAERLGRALRLDAAGGVRHALAVARSWRQLHELAARSDCGVAVVDPYHGGAFAAAELAALRARSPGVEVVAYADFTGRPAADVFALAQLGVRSLVSPGAGDDPASLRQCLEDHLRRTPFDEAVSGLAGRVAPRVRAWLEPLLRSPQGPATVDALARRLRCSPRTLRRTLAAAGLPPPEEVLAWRRLLHAARLMEDGHRSFDGVARALGCSSPSALRRCLKRLTGLRPRELAAAGGVRRVAELFGARSGRRQVAATGRGVAGADTT
ncbi:MAG TPA: helix-turn-helix transcriptional regulator [Longimicrobium sp.]|nr:helix-turn-helix transcriptional regulator [Longimicrobium sp.]